MLVITAQEKLERGSQRDQCRELVPNGTSDFVKDEPGVESLETSPLAPVVHVPQPSHSGMRKMVREACF